MREFHVARFLHSVKETNIFRQYCRTRQLPFADSTEPCDPVRWAQAISKLPVSQQAQIELELAQVNELADSEGNAHLTEAATEDVIPPVDIPGGEAYALWFFVNAPDSFTAVFFHHQVREIHAWRMGRTTPGLSCPEETLSQRTTSFSTELQTYFQQTMRTPSMCAMQAHSLPELLCFSARIADRVQFVDAFSDAGEHTIQRLRPAIPLLFAYAPKTGFVYVQSHLRSRERVRELLRCFGKAILHADVEYTQHAFDLERLKYPFAPLPDAADMEAVRLKSLSLQYPEHVGRRCVRLETLTNDSLNAIEQLIRCHLGADHSHLAVTHAELQVRLRCAGRSKNYLIRLWPDRSNLARSPLGERFRRCLQQWGLVHE